MSYDEPTPPPGGPTGYRSGHAILISGVNGMIDRLAAENLDELKGDLMRGVAVHTGEPRLQRRFYFGVDHATQVLIPPAPRATLTTLARTINHPLASAEGQRQLMDKIRKLGRVPRDWPQAPARLWHRDAVDPIERMHRRYNLMRRREKLRLAELRYARPRYPYVVIDDLLPDDFDVSAARHFEPPPGGVVEVRSTPYHEGDLFEAFMRPGPAAYRDSDKAEPESTKQIRRELLKGPS